MSEQTPEQWVAGTVKTLARLNETFYTEIRPALEARHSDSARVPYRTEAFENSLYIVAQNAFSLALAVGLDPEAES